MTLSFTFISILKSIFSFSKMYILWIIIHYITTNAYTYFCTPNNFWGLVKSPFMVLTPQCYTIDWISRKSRDIINEMWIIIGIWGTTEIAYKLDPRTISKQT